MRLDVTIPNFIYIHPFGFVLHNILSYHIRTEKANKLCGSQDRTGILGENVAAYRHGNPIGTVGGQHHVCCGL